MEMRGRGFHNDVYIDAGVFDEMMKVEQLINIYLCILGTMLIIISLAMRRQCGPSAYLISSQGFWVR